MAYIYPAPGVTGVEATLTIEAVDGTGLGDGSNDAMVVAAMQDITLEAANDVFEWTQLDQVGKLSIPTTSTNSLSGTLVVNKDQFFGDGTTNGVQNIGIWGLSTTKRKITFEVYTGDEDDGSSGKYISATGYVTGLSPTVSADQPVWTTPFTISIDGDWSVSDTATVS